jgi:DNA (cytosine-5)-methyltransferase 1
MPVYYNEIDPKAAAWLRELIKQGHIADGVVDERSIVDVTPDELRDFTQCHFFAGIGVWSYALRSAGWSDDRPVWTGSCPCQPFSAAGARVGFDDQRHLWPHWHHLISQCRPPVVFGEQVASKDGLGWLDLVHADMEATGYAFGAADLCAAGVGAPHIRQRIWFVGLADAADAGFQIGRGGSDREPGSVEQSERLCADGWLADAGSGGGAQGIPEPQQRQEGFAGEHDNSGDQSAWGQAALGATRTSPTNGFWRNADWLFCRDGRWRPVRPGSFPLAHGSSARVGRLRGYGNAIAAPVAQEFIESVMEILA